MVRQPFHMVSLSPWPVLASMCVAAMLLGGVSFFHGVAGYGSLGLLGFGGVVFIAFCWWRDVCREATLLGCHTNRVVRGVKLGMVLFITSEVMFFFGFFWAFYHSSLVPCCGLGCVWPPIGVEVIDPFGVPLLNTLVLLSSGVLVTLSHHSLMGGQRVSGLNYLIWTVVLAVYFTFLQWGEYCVSSFSIADGVYGTVFFVATGFHGLHVVVGTLILLSSVARMWLVRFSNSHHFGFEAGIWYWHFVDVVWLKLYLVVYWWGAME